MATGQSKSHMQIIKARMSSALPKSSKSKICQSGLHYVQALLSYIAIATKNVQNDSFSDDLTMEAAYWELLISYTVRSDS